MCFQFQCSTKWEHSIGIKCRYSFYEYVWFLPPQDLLLWPVSTRQYVHLVPPALGAEEGKLTQPTVQCIIIIYYMLMKSVNGVINFVSLSLKIQKDLCMCWKLENAFEFSILARKKQKWCMCNTLHCIGTCTNKNLGKTKIIILY